MSDNLVTLLAIVIGLAVMAAIIGGIIAMAVIDVHDCGQLLHYAHGRCVANAV